MKAVLNAGNSVRVHEDQMARRGHRWHNRDRNFLRVFFLSLLFVLVPMLSTARPEGKMHSSVTTIGDRELAGRARKGSRLGIHPWTWLKRHEAVWLVFGH